MKRNVLFVSTGPYAFGESVLALNFAQQLERARFNACFLVAPNNWVLLASYDQFPALTLIKDAPNVNRLLMSDFLAKFPPDIIILCDFLTFHYSTPLYGVDLSMLREYGVPIISLDSYEWESGDFQMDYFNGVVKRAPEVMKELEGGLRPCPLNRPREAAPRVACYSFLHQVSSERGMPVANSAREELGIPQEAVVFITAEALWQKIRPKSYGGPFGDMVETIVSHYLQRLGRPVHWVQISPTNQNEVVSNGMVTEYRIKPLSEPQFNSLLSSSDLLISTNVVSTTLAKCVKYGVNALLLRNSISAAGPDELDQCGVSISTSMRSMVANAYPLRPFLMFPLGFYNFLYPLVRGNPFIDTFFQAEVLEDMEVLSILDRAADRVLPSLEAQRVEYIGRLASLPSPDECLDHYLQRNPARRL